MTTKRKPKDPSSATRLLPADLERHREMVELLEEAKQLQARASNLTAAFLVHAERLHLKYGLALDGTEGVRDDGTILRTPKEA